MRVAFRVDATDRIGGGHAMRCLTLANALREQGAETLFLCGALPTALERLIGATHPLHMIAAPDGLERDAEDWHEPQLIGELQELDAARALAVLGGPADWMVVDHYLLGEAWHSAARAGAKRILVIDDLANRTLDCDLVLDQTFRRTTADYLHWLSPSAQVLAGATYALLRPEFARERPSALERRKSGGLVERILISLGTTDVDGITARVLDVVSTTASDCTIDVVLGEQSRSLTKVREIAACNPRVSIHVGTTEMAKLMRNADLAIGAAGTTSWERCCLGLPSLTLVVAGNQAAAARALADVGASVTIDEPKAIEKPLRVLLAKPEGLMLMSATAFALVDGLGTARVVDKLLRRRKAYRTWRMRAVTEADSQLLWLWRNDPQTRRASQCSDPIAWPDHERWLREVMADPDRHIWVADSDGEPAGMVRFDAVDGGFEVSINIRPDARGDGVGRTILQTACRQFSSGHPTPIFATVHRDNAASRRLFEKCGFDDCGAFGELGFRRYVLPLIVRSGERPRSIA